MIINTESFEYELSHRLSHMQDRAEKNKQYVTKILKIKKQIEIGDPITEDEYHLLDSMLDDILALNDLCNTSPDFGAFVHYHSGMDAFLK